jgi:hypothetical protein
MRLTSILFLAVIASPGLAYTECTRDQAFDKMMKLNQLSASLQAEVPLDPRTNPGGSNAAYGRIKEFSEMIAPTGKLLADGKYNEACKAYDEIAQKFGFHMKGSDALTMDQLRKDGGRKKAGDCDITEMAKRNIELATDFQKAYDAGQFTYERQREFSKASEKLNMLATSDPGAACQEIARLRAEYGL